MKYYLRRKNRVFGPLSPQQLAEGVKAKKLLLTDELSLYREKGFTPLKDVYEVAIKGKWNGEIGIGALSILADKPDSGTWIDLVKGAQLSSSDGNMSTHAPLNNDIYGVSHLLQKAEQEQRLAIKQQQEESASNKKSLPWFPELLYSYFSLEFQHPTC